MIDKIFNKNKYELYNIFLLITIIIINKILKIENLQILIIMIFVYYLLILKIINKFFTVIFLKTKFQIFTFIDTLNIFVIRISLRYIFLSLIIISLILTLIYKTDGINGVKKGVSLFIIYYLIKFIFILVMK